jgi:2-dehydro-3-deoxyphosphogluconate aldolase / (4S)-4-hydroxy-2-oxoglutarate aldolase
MMTRRSELFARVAAAAAIGVVREDDTAVAWEVAAAYASHGLRVVEITMTTPDAAAVIERLVSEYGARGLIVAAGTVRSSEDAAAARRSGATILVSPHTDLRVIDYAAEHDLLCVAGAATPTEIIRAWESGASVVKVYPAAHLGGADYIRTIRGPIRDVPMLAGGPVPLEQIDAYLDAGCIAVNLGTSLAVPAMVQRKAWDEIGERVAHAVSILSARREVPLSEPLVH